MGEMADAILNGEFCQICGEHLGAGEGYATYCAGCAKVEKVFLTPKQLTSIINLTLQNVQKQLGGILKPELGEHLGKHFHGVLSKLYLDDFQSIRHDGLERTILNNNEAKRRAIAKRTRENAKNNVKEGTA